MPDVSVVPGSLLVRNLFEDLLGREVTVSPAEPLAAEELATAAVAVYVDERQQLVAGLALELSLAAHAGAALGLLPAGDAEDSIERRRLSPELAENVGELSNVLTSLLNREGQPHVKLYQVVDPGGKLPSDVRAYLLALGRRLDLRVDVARYGAGRLSLSFVT
jgi:hypothetical protein